MGRGRQHGRPDLRRGRPRATIAADDGGVGRGRQDRAGLSFGLPFLFAGIVVLLIYRVTHRPAPPVMAADGLVRLHGQLTPASTLISFSQDTIGTVEVTPSELIWRSQATPEWRVPIPFLLLHPPGVFGRNPGMVFEAPGAGRWRLLVSDRAVSPFITDFERRRLRERAEELRYVLVSRGARMVAGR